MDDIDHKIESLIQGILGYSEKKSRASSLREKFRGLALDEVAAILNQICIGAITRDLKYLKAYSVLPEFIDSLFDSPHELSQLRRIAREKNFPEVMQLFLDLPPKRMPVEDLEFPEDPALKDLPIGRRKSLAKTQNLTLLKKLLHEQNPSVIRTLLMNPRLTESDVLRVASLKPTSPAILEEVFSHSKWIARYRVKKALVLNPYCPPAIALHLLKFMLVSDLQVTAQDENLHPFVQETAHQLLSAKESSRPLEPPEPEPFPEPS